MRAQNQLATLAAIALLATGTNAASQTPAPPTASNAQPAPPVSSPATPPARRPSSEAVGVGVQPARAVPARTPAGGPPATSQPAISTTASPVAAAAPPPVATPAPDTAAARAMVRIEQLEAELRAMTDRLERLEAEVANQRNRPMQPQATTEPGPPAPASQSAEAAPAPAATSLLAQTASSDTTPAPPQPAVQPAPAGPAAAPAATPAAPPSSRLATLAADATPANVLRDARLSLQTREFAQAEANLAALVQRWPDAPESAEGRWLLGEARYVQRAWGPAAEAYVDYLGTNPQGRRVPEIYLRLAGVFREVGDQEQRCRALGAFADTVPEPGPVLAARYAQEAAQAPTCGR
jgi:TolA-binding protein